MKLFVDPMPKLIQQAQALVNTTYAEDHHKIIDYKQTVYARKRTVAMDVKAGKEASEAFKQEAALRNMTIEAFADLVLSKGDAITTLDSMELKRQQILTKLEGATSPEQVKAILAVGRF